jgi:hypothetical protein
MRDIRADLRERLEIAQAEAVALDQAAADAEARVDAIKALLEAEEARLATSNVTPDVAEFTRRVLSGEGPGPAFQGITPAPVPPEMPMDDFLVKAVKRGVSQKDELRDAAIRAGYFKGSVSSPGRVVHAKLTNLVKDGTLVKVGDDFVVSAG